jgi:hypothetical protein
VATLTTHSQRSSEPGAPDTYGSEDRWRIADTKETQNPEQIQPGVHECTWNKGQHSVPADRPLNYPRVSVRSRRMTSYDSVLRSRAEAKGSSWLAQRYCPVPRALQIQNPEN